MWIAVHVAEIKPILASDWLLYRLWVIPNRAMSEDIARCSLQGWRVIASSDPMEENEKNGRRSRMKQREMYKETRSDRSNVHRPLGSASYRHPGAESRSRSSTTPARENRFAPNDIMTVVVMIAITSHFPSKKDSFPLLLDRLPRLLHRILLL